MKERLGAGKANNRGARAAAAREIAKRPESYQVCLGCESILAASLSVCPQCHAYRFETDPETIRKRAHTLARRRPGKLFSD